MCKFHDHTVFSVFFKSVSTILNYNNMLAKTQTYYFSNVRTNYGIFNVRFQGPTVLNCIDEDIKSTSIAIFK